ncbi:MAG: hypothetical protein JWN90_88 [Parcubacteria group bacterium]|nr:hypothetical protein [Parcubacteria group bacterium]
MERLSVKECLSFGWSAFKIRPWLFVQVSAIVVLANLVISGIQSVLQVGGSYVLGPNSDVVMVAAAVVGMGLSFLVSMGKTAFYLGAHDSVEGSSLRALWHPYPYVKFVGTSLLLGLVVLVGFILVIVPGIIFGVMFGFSLYLVIEEDLNPIEAFKKSALLTKGNRMPLFLLGLALIGINLIGLIVFLVGLLVTLPVSALAVVHAYRTLAGHKTLEQVVAAV